MMSEIERVPQHQWHNPDADSRVPYGSIMLGDTDGDKSEAAPERVTAEGFFQGAVPAVSFTDQGGFAPLRQPKVPAGTARRGRPRKASGG